MKAGKSMVLVGGIGMILVLLAFRLNAVEKIKQLTQPEQHKTTTAKNAGPDAAIKPQTPKADTPQATKAQPETQKTPKPATAKQNANAPAKATTAHQADNTSKGETVAQATADEKQSTPAKEPKAQTTPPAVPEQAAPEQVAPEQAAPEQPLGAGDPFSYATACTGDFSPLSGNKHVGTISVKGIIHIESEEPKAILHIKDTDRVHYVSKNSVVRVSTIGKKGATPSEAYIVVQDIRNDEVELIQMERPDKIIIIR